MPVTLKPETIRWSRSDAGRLQVGATKEPLRQQQLEVRFGPGFRDVSQVAEALREVELLLLGGGAFTPEMEERSERWR